MADEQKIIDMYVNEKYTCTAIGNILGLYRRTVSSILKKNNIEIFKKRRNISPKSIIGSNFGLLTVISKNEDNTFLCSCKCGNTTNLSRNTLITNHTKSCGCYNISCRTTGGKFVTGTILSRVKQGAIIRNIVYDLSVEYLDDLFERQNFKCALSSLPIEFAKSKKDFNNKKQTASLDRIDSSKGYIEGNVQWVHKDVNLMKQDYDEKYYINICKLVAENKKTC